MTFIKEGKLMSYLEVLQWLSTLDKNDVLDHLEESELKGLYSRLLQWQLDLFRKYIKETDEEKKDEQELFEKLYGLKLISSVGVWKEAKALQDAMNGTDKVGKGEIISFMRESYIPEMQKIQPKITRWEEYIKAKNVL